jgi:hypothetical protein
MPMTQEKDNSPQDSDWAQRVLCSDESCIGVIGPDGRCKECGLAYKGTLPWDVETGPPGETADDPSHAPLSEEGEELPQDAGDWDEDQERVSDDEWERRVLCSDESCIGVIGPDGRCKECGKPFGEN